jgi:predicted porin
MHPIDLTEILIRRTKLKKSLLALAVAGAFIAPGVASADANVSLWGWLNPSLGATKYDAHTSAGNSLTAATASAEIPNRLNLSPNVSLIGISGSEDLGNGLKAVFRAETGFGIEGTTYAAATDPGLYTRESKVGLQGSWGEVFFGIWHSPYKALGYGHHNNFGSVLLDQFGEANNATVKGIMGMPGFAQDCSGTGASTVAGISFGGCRYTFDLRLANSIAYWSPVMNENLSFQVVYSANEGKTSGAAGINPSIWAANVIFDNGTFGFGAAFEKHTDAFGLSAAALAGAAPTGSDDVAYKLTGGWKGGGFNVNLSWENLDYENEGVAAGLNSYERSAWALGASYSWDAHSVRARYSSAEDGDCSIAGGAACSTAGQGADSWAFGYTYALSKRTQLIANWVQVDNEDNAQYGLGYGSDANFVGGPGQEIRSLSVGIQHGF